jgi:hypothetical protein
VRLFAREPRELPVAVVHQLPNGRTFTVYVARGGTLGPARFDGWYVAVAGRRVPMSVLMRGWIAVEPEP